MSEGRTGALVSALAEGVREDLAEIATGIDDLRAAVDELGEAARAINGLADDCRGWSNHLGAILDEVRKVGVEVPAKLLGAPLPTIAQSVNTELAEKVKNARKSEAA